MLLIIFSNGSFSDRFLGLRPGFRITDPSRIGNAQSCEVVQKTVESENHSTCRLLTVPSENVALGLKADTS